MDFVNALYDYDLKKLAEPYGPKLQRFDRLANYMKVAIKGLSDVTTSALSVAEALYIIKAEELFKDYPFPGDPSRTFHTGLKDFLSFCKVCFGASKSTVYNNLAIYERFGKPSEGSEGISPNFRSFTYTQLSLLLPLSDSELAHIKPSMSCSEIKKYVKEVKSKREEEQFSNRLENENSGVEELFEEYNLNNDERRAAFLDTYERWTKEPEIEIVGNKIRFFSCVLSDKATLVCVETSKSDYKFTSYFLFGSEEYNYCYNMSSILNLGQASSHNMIVRYLRDKQIKSVKLNKG